MADLKNTEIDDNLELPSGTTGERPSSPQEGQIRYNTDLETAEFYNGENWRPLSDTHAEATGGTVIDTDIGGVPYRIHLFTETGTDTLTVTNPGEVEYLIVAGGGGGGQGGSGEGGCGGGGAGGLVTGLVSVGAQSYSIDVGTGGSISSNGSDSSAFGLTAIGGGAGGNGGQNGSSGGSGGGGSQNGGTQGGTALQPGSTDSGFGNNGGDTTGSNTGGGGGGAGAAGGFGDDDAPEQAAGGAGIVSNITGNNSFFAGGGAGGENIGGGQGSTILGGLGGGGSSIDRGFDAVPNTGGGGGGAGSNNEPGGAGGSGIVIVRYPKNSTLTTQPERTDEATQPLNLPVPGRHLFNISGSSETIDYYYLDPPFDVENRQLIYEWDAVSITSDVSRVDNLALSNDGTVLYLCATNDVLKYTLRRPFDIASAQLDFRLTDFHSATEPTCFEFADNGKKFYDHQGSNGELLQYELSTRYDIRTRTQTGSLGGFSSWGPGDPAFSPDGSRVAIGERKGSQIIRGGFCSTPFDLSTYRQETTFDPSDNDPSCCKWNGDGTTLYVRHASPDMVNEFSTPNPYSLVGMTFVQQVMPDTSFAAGGLHINYNF